MESEGSLPHSQKPATCPYPELALEMNAKIMGVISLMKVTYKIFTINLTINIIQNTLEAPVLEDKTRKTVRNRREFNMEICLALMGPV